MSIFNNQTFNTVLGLRDTQPFSKGGRNSESQTHAKGSGTNLTIPSKASNLDLDGVVPTKYTDNLPR